MTATEMQGRRRWAGLALWLAATLSAGAIGALLQGSDVPGRYARLPTPSWAPPPALFGPVWSVLYVLMGVAAWRVWSRFGFAGAGPALTLFILQLLVNAGWSPVFFGLDEQGVALAIILILDVLVAATIALFLQKDRIAAYLLMPYLAWILFATALNAAIVF